MLLAMAPGARREAIRGLVLLSEAADSVIRRGRAYLEAVVEGEVS